MSALVVNVLFDDEKGFLLLVGGGFFGYVVDLLVLGEFLDFAVDLLFEVNQFHVSQENNFVLFLSV